MTTGINSGGGPITIEGSISLESGVVIDTLGEGVAAPVTLIGSINPISTQTLTINAQSISISGALGVSQVNLRATSGDISLSSVGSILLSKSFLDAIRGNITIDDHTGTGLSLVDTIVEAGLCRRSPSTHCCCRCGN